MINNTKVSESEELSLNALDTNKEISSDYDKNCFKFDDISMGNFKEPPRQTYESTKFKKNDFMLKKFGSVINLKNTGNTGSVTDRSSNRTNYYRVLTSRDNAKNALLTRRDSATKLPKVKLFFVVTTNLVNCNDEFDAQNIKATYYQ